MHACLDMVAILLHEHLKLFEIRRINWELVKNSYFSFVIIHRSFEWPPAGVVHKTKGPKSWKGFQIFSMKIHDIVLGYGKKGKK